MEKLAKNSVKNLWKKIDEKRWKINKKTVKNRWWRWRPPWWWWKNWWEKVWPYGPTSLHLTWVCARNVRTIHNAKNQCVRGPSGKSEELVAQLNMWLISVWLTFLLVDCRKNVSDICFLNRLLICLEFKSKLVMNYSFSVKKSKFRFCSS